MYEVTCYYCNKELPEENFTHYPIAESKFLKQTKPACIACIREKKMNIVELIYCGGAK